MLEMRMKKSMSRRTFLAAATASVVLGQENASSPDAKFSTDVKVVNVLATVRDKQGKIVSGFGERRFRSGGRCGVSRSSDISPARRIFR